MARQSDKPAVSITLRGMIFAGVALAGVSSFAAQPGKPAPLPLEDTGRVETLPETYPEDWVLVDEASFFAMSAGRVIVLDVGESVPNKRIKGMMDKNLLGNFTRAKKRPEFYIMESFHERGTRGKKFDVLAIYNKRTLKIEKEILWDKTGTERLQALPTRYSMTLSSDERFLFVANFNPAGSFTVVDLDSREIVETISTPGCVLTYPTGDNNVTSICSNGGLLTSVLDEQGHLESQTRMKPFFDTQKTPVFERPAMIDGIAYFPGFKGVMHVIDLRGETAEYVDNWEMTTPEERAENWRPSGLVPMAWDDRGQIYAIMQPDGHEGTHQEGGPEIWVFDPQQKKRLRRIAAPNWAISLEVTRGEDPMIVATSGELGLDIFDADSGELLRTVNNFGQVTPLLVHKAY